MDAFLDLMVGNASALDWLTAGAIAWLIYKTRNLTTDLGKHEDACVLFRRDMYKRVGKAENEIAVLKERTGDKS